MQAAQISGVLFTQDAFQLVQFVLKYNIFDYEKFLQAPIALENLPIPKIQIFIYCTNGAKQGHGTSQLDRHR